MEHDELKDDESQLRSSPPIGILAFSWIAIQVRFARLPSGVDWKTLLGAACLCGIGFTMSIFIAGLALPENLLDEGKTGTLVGSTISAIVGCLVLFISLPPRPAAASGGK